MNGKSTPDPIFSISISPPLALVDSDILFLVVIFAILLQPDQFGHSDEDQIKIVTQKLRTAEFAVGLYKCPTVRIELCDIECGLA